MSDVFEEIVWVGKYIVIKWCGLWEYVGCVCGIGVVVILVVEDGYVLLVE